jgi:hypothetical protein
MAAEIINLRHARKQKTRVDKARRSAENRAAFGRTNVDKQNEAAEAARTTKAHDGHKRDDGDVS